MSSFVPSTEQLKKVAIDAATTAVAVAFASQTVLGKNLGVPISARGIAMLAAAIRGGTLAVQYLKKEKLIPEM